MYVWNVSNSPTRNYSKKHPPNMVNMEFYNKKLAMVKALKNIPDLQQQFLYAIICFLQFNQKELPE